jgi:hypothetical protein
LTSSSFEKLRKEGRRQKAGDKKQETEEESRSPGVAEVQSWLSKAKIGRCEFLYAIFF